MAESAFVQPARVVGGSVSGGEALGRKRVQNDDVTIFRVCAGAGPKFLQIPRCEGGGQGPPKLSEPASERRE